MSRRSIPQDMICFQVNKRKGWKIFLRQIVDVS